MRAQSLRSSMVKKKQKQKKQKPQQFDTGQG
jgi:hypothetical protein